jgi:Lrp/AsnC family transcriptional regulator
MSLTNLDNFDRKILAYLQQNCASSNAEIAEKTGLSPSPCWRRIDRMDREGIITKRVALVDRRKAGFNAQIFAQVKLNAHGRANLDEFTTAIRAFPEVLECFVLMGPVDFMLRIIAKDIEAYERFFFDKLSRLPGVQEINSTVALSEIKSTTALPL